MNMLYYHLGFFEIIMNSRRETVSAPGLEGRTPRNYPSLLAACPFWALTARVAHARYGQALSSPPGGEGLGEGVSEEGLGVIIT